MGWRRFFRRARWDREREAELRSYLEIETDENIARGMSPADARHAAQRKLGNTLRIREEIYDMNTIGSLELLGRELRFVCRGMRRRPGFTAAVVVTLALGVGATTAIFSVVDGVLIRPLPYPDSHELVSLRHSAPGLQPTELAASPTLYFTYRDEGRVFEHVGLWAAGGTTMSGFGEPEQARVVWVTYGTLQALGVQPQFGRWFSQSDDMPDAPGPDPVILTHAFWQRRFGGDAPVVGRRVVIDNGPAEIIGVMPEGFRFLNLQPQPDVILTQRFRRNGLALGPLAAPASRATPWGQGIARLKPGVTLEEANADVRRMLPIWLDAWPAQPGVVTREAIEQWGLAPALRPLKQDVVGNVADMLWVLMATIGLVLLIACANVANLMLVRADGRRQEFSVRAALGAGRFRIAKEILLESVVLGLVGGTFGLLLAWGGLRLLVGIGPANMPRLDEISLDPRAFAFAMAASLLASLMFGSIPAFKHGSLTGSPLGSGARGATASRERHRTRDTLVVVQVALALVLLVCAGLMIRTFDALRNVTSGFAGADEVQTLRLWVPPSAIRDPERFTRVQHEVLDRIAALPGVTGVGFASMLPMEGRVSEVAIVVEHHVSDLLELPPRRTKWVSPGFFSTMETRIVAGRDVSWSDIYDRARVVLVSETFAREVWGSAAAALGRRIREAGPPDRAPVWREIVGVVEDVREDGLHQAAPAFVYWPVLMGDFGGQATFGMRATVFAIRSPDAGTESLMNGVRQAVWSVNRDMPVFLVRTMQDLYDESLATTSFALVMLAIAAAMALGLGVVGIYGVISYVVSQRSREIGLRIALGAEPTLLTRMFVMRGLALTAVGLAAGMTAAVALTRLMASLLFEITPLDLGTHVSALAILLTAAALASYLPARRAAAVNPTTALMTE